MRGNSKWTEGMDMGSCIQAVDKNNTKGNGIMIKKSKDDTKNDIINLSQSSILSD